MSLSTLWINRPWAWSYPETVCQQYKRVSAHSISCNIDTTELPESFHILAYMGDTGGVMLRGWPQTSTIWIHFEFPTFPTFWGHLLNVWGWFVWALVVLSRGPWSIVTRVATRLRSCFPVEVVKALEPKERKPAQCFDPLIYQIS